MITMKMKRVVRKKVAALVALCSIAANAPAACDEMWEHELDEDVAFEEAYELPQDVEVENNGVKKVPVRKQAHAAFKRTHQRMHGFSAEDDCVSSPYGGQVRRVRRGLVLAVLLGLHFMRTRRIYHLIQKLLIYDKSRSSQFFPSLQKFPVKTYDVFFPSMDDRYLSLLSYDYWRWL